MARVGKGIHELFVRDPRRERNPFVVHCQGERGARGRKVYATFNERMVRRAPLRGQYYITDARRVHNLIVGFLQGEHTEN